MVKKHTLEKNDFKKFVGNIYNFYRFEKAGIDYELCFEPCKSGFDIALYTRHPYRLIGKKICLSEQGYADDAFGQMARRPETWKHALQEAEELLTKI